MCDHATVQDNLSDYPLLKNLLPDDYIYHVCSFEPSVVSSDFRAKLKLKLTTEEEVLKWQEDFQASSGSIWRKSKTYPDAGHGSNKYRMDFRCHRNTRSNIAKRSKNTSCPAFMYLVLKRNAYSKGRKSRSEDPHIKEGYHFCVAINNTHNHHVSFVADLVTNDVSIETSYGDDAHIEFCEDIPPVEEDSELCAGPPSLEDDLIRVFKSLTLKLRDDPSFIAPLTSFIASFDKMSTDSALQSALSLFGKSTLAKASRNRRSNGFVLTSAQIGDPLTAVASRKTPLGRRRTSLSGRPPKVLRKDHSYEKTGKKPGAPHSLAHCVEGDMSLDETQ